MLTSLQRRSDLILTISRYEHRLSGSVEQFKAVVQLVDTCWCSQANDPLHPYQ